MSPETERLESESPCKTRGRQSRSARMLGAVPTHRGDARVSADSTGPGCSRGAARRGASRRGAGAARPSEWALIYRQSPVAIVETDRPRRFRRH